MSPDWASPTLQVVADPTVMWRSLDDDLVLYHHATDNVTRLNQIGTQVWHRLDVTVTIQDLVAELAKDFDADSDQVANDVVALLKELFEARLIQTP